MDIVFMLLAVALVGWAVLTAFSPLLAHWLLKPGVGQGNHVAEVWLEWSLGRGSTMYRQRFKTQKQAAQYMRIYAWVLDLLLPRHFVDTDRAGRCIRVSNNLSIMYGVRRITEEEQKGFQSIWSTVMPGYTGYTGEHATAHPWAKRNDQLSAMDSELKI